MCLLPLLYPHVESFQDPRPAHRVVPGQVSRAVFPVSRACASRVLPTRHALLPCLSQPPTGTPDKGGCQGQVNDGPAPCEDSIRRPGTLETEDPMLVSAFPSFLSLFPSSCLIFHQLLSLLFNILRVGGERGHGQLQRESKKQKKGER